MIRLKAFIKKKLGGGFLLIKAYRYLNSMYLPPKGSVEEVLKKFSLENRKVVFIQVGSNDGKSGDPLYKYILENKWKGVLVEPLNYLFKRLLESYKDAKSDLYFENAAIASKGDNIFYYLKYDSRLPEWYEQLGSFRYDIVKSHVQHLQNGEDLIATAFVNSCTFQELLDKYQLSKVDLLHIDTEGFDYEVLKMVPFQKIKPKLILFEHKHLAVRDYKNAIRLLKKSNYLLCIDSGDTICTLQ